MDKKALQLEFENDSTKNYIVTYLENEQDIVNYEVKIINESPTLGALTVEIKQLNHKVKVRYDVTKKIAIKEYLKGITLTKVEFINIVTNIANCLIGCKNYFLDEKKFLVNLDTLFIDEKNLKVYLLYCPFKMEVVEDTDLVYRDIVKSLIIDCISFDEKNSENVIQKTLSYFRKDEFNMAEFKDYLSEFKEQNINVVCDTASMDNENHYSINNKSVNNVLLLFLQLIVLGIIGLIAMIGSFGAIMITVMVVVIAIDIILVFVFTRTNGVKKAGIIANKLEISFIKQKPQNTNRTNKTIKTEMSCETELLDEGTAYLLSKKPGTMERIYIDKKKFRIGRIPGEVDYVSDNIAIGKIHAEIRKNIDKYYLVDLKSKNGTYVNGEKLHSNELYEIKNEDIIVFANSECTFFIS
jgi:hypothetical protein